MKIFKNLSIIAALAISSYAGTANGVDSESSDQRMPIERKSNTNNETIVSGSNSAPIILKENDLLTNDDKTELLKNPEVIKLINESYKKGFIQGAEESKLVMKKKIERMGKFMDELFAFHKLYLEGKMEPPKVGVVSEPVQVTKNGSVMVIQQEYLEIIEPAKFVDKPKTWKNFMLE